MKVEKSWEQLCDEVRNAPYGLVNYSPESAIKFCEEIGEKNEGKPMSYGDGIQTNVKERQLEHIMYEYMITDVFQVGAVTVKQVGESYENVKMVYLGEIDGKPKYNRIPTGQMKAKYHMFRSAPVEAIDVFRIDQDGTRQPIDEYKYCTREEIVELAQKHSDIMTNRSEDVTVVFPTGELEIANYFREGDEGFDELPKDIKWNSEYSIYHAVGRAATAQWLADNRNMAYGQLGNTSCSVYKVNDDKLVITSAYPYGEDEDGYEVEIPVPEGWEFVCGISCGVWRIELVDRKALEEYDFPLEEYKKDEYKDFGSVKVNPGTWEMKTYYQQRSDKELMDDFGFPIWAELNRK